MIYDAHTQASYKLYTLLDSFSSFTECMPLFEILYGNRSWSVCDLSQFCMVIVHGMYVTFAILYCLYLQVITVTNIIRNPNDFPVSIFYTGPTIQNDSYRPMRPFDTYWANYCHYEELVITCSYRPSYWL